MFQLYHDYFFWLCHLHPAFAHSNAQRVFELVSVDEAFGDYRGHASKSGFIFRLIDYTWGIDEIGDFHFQRKRGGFIVAKNMKTRDALPAVRITARNQCETIINDFITHMLADSNNGHPMFSGNQDEPGKLRVNVTPALNIGDGTYDGAMCTYDFCPEHNYALDCHPVDEWQELSPFDYPSGSWATNSGSRWLLNNSGEWQLQ